MADLQADRDWVSAVDEYVFERMRGAMLYVYFSLLVLCFTIVFTICWWVVLRRIFRRQRRSRRLVAPPAIIVRDPTFPSIGNWHRGQEGAHAHRWNLVGLDDVATFDQRMAWRNMLRNMAPDSLVRTSWDQDQGVIPAVRTVYIANNWHTFASRIWRPPIRLTPLERLMRHDPDAYDRIVAARYKRTHYRSFGCLSWIPLIAQQVEHERRLECIDQLRQYANIIGEDDESFVPVPYQKRRSVLSCWRQCIASFIPDTTGVWRRREFARLETLVRTSKVVLNYTRAQLGSLEYSNKLEEKSLRIALGQAVRTLDGKGDIKVRVSQYPFVVDCCMFLIDPHTTSVPYTILK